MRKSFRCKKKIISETELLYLINQKVDKIEGKGLSTCDFTENYRLLLLNTSKDLNNKVDKEAGKSLTSNDFTNAYKQKLDSVQRDAQVNVIEEVRVNNDPLTVTGKAVNLDLSSYIKYDYLQIELDKKENVANKTTNLSSNSTNLEYPSAKATFDFVNDKLSTVYKSKGSKTVAELNALVVDASMNGFVYNVTDSGTLTSGNVQVDAGDNVLIVWNEGLNNFIWDKLSSFFTVDLSGYYTKEENDTLLNTKVDKITGKGLSTNDYNNTEKGKVTANTNARHTHSNKAVLDNITAAYTTEEASKLLGIAAGAQANVIESIKVNGVAQAVVNKAVNISIPSISVENYTVQSNTLKKLKWDNSDEVVVKYAIKDSYGTDININQISGRIDALESVGRFLALWNATMGVAVSDPPSSPYRYKTGDYFRVSVAGNRIPTGLSYTIGGTNYTTSQQNLSVGDVIYFDGTVWKIQNSGSGGQVVDVQVNGYSVVAAGVANITKNSLDLGNVDNTSDADKPISTATQSALDGKVPTTRKVNGHELSSDVTVSKSDVGLGNVENKSVATIKQEMTGTIAQNNQGFVKGDEIFVRCMLDLYRHHIKLRCIKQNTVYAQSNYDFYIEFDLIVKQAQQMTNLSQLYTYFDKQVVAVNYYAIDLSTYGSLIGHSLTINGSSPCLELKHVPDEGYLVAIAFIHPAELSLVSDTVTVVGDNPNE